MDYFVREYRDSDREELVSLLERGLNIGRADDRLRSVYEANPAGPALVSVAEDRSSGKVIAAYAVFPFRLMAEGEVLLVGQRGDLIVDRSFRGQGIFKALRPHVVARASEAGMAFTLSMPNPAAWAGHRSMGCTEVGRLVTMLLPLDATRIARRYLPGNVLGSVASHIVGVVGGLIWREARFRDRGEYTCHPLSAFDERFDQLWQEASSLRAIMTIRDRTYLHWRWTILGRDQWALTVERGSRLAGYALVRRRADGMAEIKDFLTTQDEGAATSLIHAVAAQARTEGMAGVAFQSLEDCPYFDAFQRCGFRIVPRASGSALVLVPGAVEVMSPSWGQSSNWYLTAGDRE